MQKTVALCPLERTFSVDQHVHSSSASRDFDNATNFFSGLDEGWSQIIDTKSNLKKQKITEDFKNALIW